MSLMSKEQYLESLSELGHRVFIQGKQVGDVSKNTIAAPGAMAMAETYQQAHESPELFTAKSHLSGERINRFTHMGIQPDNLMAALNCIASQRLIRTLCECKTRYTPEEAELLVPERVAFGVAFESSEVIVIEQQKKLAGYAILTEQRFGYIVSPG